MKLKALFSTALALAALTSFTPEHAAFAKPHPHHEAASFPMKADEYRALMEKRIDAVRAVIDRKLDRRGVSADRKKAIHKVFDESSQDLRAEIARVTADGTVTQAEATRVKTLTTGLRAKVRERLRAEKHGTHSPATKPLKSEAPGAPEKTAKAKPAGSKTVSAKPGAAKKHSGHDAGPTKQAKAEPAKKAKSAKKAKKPRQTEADPGSNL